MLIPLWSSPYWTKEKWSRELFARYAHEIIIPYITEEHNIMSCKSLEWQFAQLWCTGIFSYEIPSHSYQKA